MLSHRFISMLLLFIFIYTITQISHQAKKYVILFDLTNVLIKENQVGFAKKIGYGTLASYTLTHWKNPGHRCLDMLAAISKHETQKPHISITLKDRIMPRCIVELQEGKKTCAETKGELTQSIAQLDTEKFFSSIKEKNLMTTIINLILDPETVASVIEPIKPMIQLAQKLKNAGHKIYIVGNAAEELYAIVKNTYPDILKHFDGAVISSHIKIIKPNIAVFNHLCTAYNLDPKDCILIDDLEETAAAARQLGMQTIVHDKISHVIKKLKKCGVIL
ncbi:MAG TPA: HAD-IA family hydrolase [Candidatus Babeliales bacterium]|nr:HAD-IA family hydrolase [Candidatus Babeliales bacterium]